MRMERGESRDQMIVDGDSEADWKQEGHFSGCPVGKTLPFNSGGGVGTGSILGWGANIPHASWTKKTLEYKQQKQYCNDFKKDLKWPVFKKIFFKDRRVKVRDHWW